MIVYHGTTRQRARRIAQEGFLPKPPSRRVWFARNNGYAKQRAHNQARRAHDRPIVLVCDIDLERLRQRHGNSKVILNGNVISIKGEVPATALRSREGVSNTPETPQEIAHWINGILDVKPHRGVSPRDAGVRRIARWVENRLASNTRAEIGNKELLSRARQWLPESFADREVDFDHLCAWRRAEVVPWEAAGACEGDIEVDPREIEALECLESDKPPRRQRGLRLLAELRDPDLFEWCVMMLADEHKDVQVIALKTMRQCDEIEFEVVEDIARSEDKRLRAAAIEVLELHGGDMASEWFWKGLTDPEPHVRLSAVKYLDRLDPKEHRDVFETALYDPHPQIAQAARRLTQGMGYEKIIW
jgi:hypothetical protein